MTEIFSDLPDLVVQPKKFPINTMKTVNFGGWKIAASEVFFTSSHSLGIVNYKPILDGHVLVLPKRQVPRLKDLLPEEQADFFNSIVTVSNKLEGIFKGTSLTITIQDGKEAGQTVEHLHCHLIPRSKGDYLNNDDIYRDIDHTSVTPGDELQRASKGPDSTREPRSAEVMAAEAAMLREHFTQYEDLWTQ